MEAAVSSSMGAMGPVLRKLDLLLAPESRLRKRVKDGIELLKQDLEEVSSALLDLSMLETPNPRAKCWMGEARELSYHVEDFIDELMLMRTDAGAKIRSASRHRVGRVKIAVLPAPPRRSTRIAKIAQLRDLLLQANQRLERYQLDDCCSSPKHMNMITQHHRAPALYGDAANLVGIEGSRTKLIEMLTGEAEQQLKVVSIVGPAGVGKTTLVKEISRELRGQFELRVFVHASRKINMRRFLGSILSQVQPHRQLPSVAGSVQSLIDIIQEQLQDKSYFIVIDDLWEETAWDVVRGVFPEGNNCSRIVATTENMNAALKCCGYIADNILEMKPLGIQDSGYLFFNHVFGSEQQCPDELKDVSYGIIRKCCGLPLSLIHVAGLLASIDYSELWYSVHDRLCSIVNTSHTTEEIQKKILNLSYNSLPRYLKTCLLYFNLYPEGYIMWKVHLVKQWIAEGFINAAEEKDREEIAEGYFEELVNRGMVQPMEIDYNDQVLSCTVHHIVLDLIIHNSNEESFIAAIDYSETITRLSTKAHRLSFWFSSAKYAKQPARITMSQLRSLGFFGFLKCMPPFVEFKHLRVLVLDFWGSHDGHMSLNLSRICILLQLRYLKISGDIMVELPAKMQGLQYLETLEIDARLSAVPLDIVHLPSLLHLGLRAATKLPDGIGHIKSLSTLLYFDLRCNSEDNIWSLSKLTNLQHLHLTCSSSLSSEHLKRKLIPVVVSLGKFCNLKSLTLAPDGLRTSIFIDIWSGISSPSMFLQKLELLPPICFFYRLPTWIGELHKLCILKIVVKELQGNDISNISGLPSLSVFSLYVQIALTGTVVFNTMAFPALKYFKFTCGVMCLAFQAGAMPNLQRVKLCFNAHRGCNHNRVLDGIEHLINLQEVVGRIGVLPGADESDWRVVKLSFEDIIRKHPRCPRFNSQMVDFIEEEYPPFLMKQEYPPLDKFHLSLHGGSSSEHEIVERACTEDMDKHVDSRLSREDLPPASGTSYHYKSDEYSTERGAHAPASGMMAMALSSSCSGGGGTGAANPMALVQGYMPEELAIAGEFLTTWLPFLSTGLGPSCASSLRGRVDSLLPRAEESPPQPVDQIEPSGWDSNPAYPQNLSFEPSGWDSDPSPPPSPSMSWADKAQEDALAVAADDDAAAAAADYGEEGAEAWRPKVRLTREQREQRRLGSVVRNKDFVCLERVHGRLFNILAGLELHAGVFSAAEERRIVQCVYDLQSRGQRGELGECTYIEPKIWMRGKGRVTIQFGCYYNYATDKNGNPPGIIRTIVSDPMPDLFKTMIKRLVRWQVLPITCVPDSCVVNIYEPGDCIPPHIDSHDFVRPFCTASFLSECNILFGSNLKASAPGEFTGSVAIPLPVGSVLVLNGSSADVAKHCVPAVPTKRISITFRKMDPAKRPFDFKDDPELFNLTPRGTVVQETGISPDEGKGELPDIQITNLSEGLRGKRSKGRTTVAGKYGSSILGERPPGNAQAPAVEVLSLQSWHDPPPVSASSDESKSDMVGRTYQGKRRSGG